MNFADMLDNHKALGADISIATIPVGQRGSSEFGILKSSEGLITSFVEKPKKEILPDWESDTGEHMKAKAGITWPPWVFIFSTASCCLICS